jgi:hypothetical protein
LFSDTLNLHTSLPFTPIRNYRQNCKFFFKYFNHCVFRRQTRRQNVVNGMVASITRTHSSLNLIFSLIKFWFLTVVSKYFNFASFSKYLWLILRYNFALHSGVETSICS